MVVPEALVLKWRRTSADILTMRERATTKGRGGPELRRNRPPKGKLRAEDGLTLIELMVAIVLLGVILSAVAAALISSARASLTNERRFQSTAYLTSEHEQLQSIPWAQAALYEDELDDLVDATSFDFLTDLNLDLDLAATPPTFEGSPIATIPGPTLTGRLFFVPEPVSEGVRIGVDDREYDVVRLVTERPDGNRRFTTFVTWRVLGDPVVQRFDSERAPTPGELAQLEREGVLQFLISPRPVEVNVDGTPDAGPTIVARFSDPMNSVQVTFLPPEGAEGSVRPQTIVLDGDDLVIHQSGDARNVLFTNTGQLVDGVAETDPGVKIVFGAVGEWTVELQATRTDGPDIDVTSTLLVEEVPTPPARPQLSSVSATPSPGVVDIGIFDIDPFRLCSSVQVSATVDWGSATPQEIDNSSVLASYAGVTSQSLPMTTTNNTNYNATLAAGTLSPWLPPAGQDFRDRFWIVAVDANGRASLLESSNVMTFRGLEGTCS